MRDLHSNDVYKRTVAPQTVGTTGTGRTGKPVDRQGYDGVEFIISYGTITATAAVFTVTAKEGDVTGTMTSVADANLLGTELAAGIAAGTPRTSDSNKDVVKRLGYIGTKRYVSMDIKSTVTAGTPVGINVRMGFANQRPLAT